MQENITLTLSLVSYLAAADCASGVAGNIDISKHTCAIIYHQQDPDNMDVLEVTFPQNGSFSQILHHVIVDNISFQMNLVSHLAAADCAFGVAGNIEINQHTCTIIYHQDPDDMDKLEVTFPQNGSLFFKNTSRPNRRQYVLSNEPSQPFGRSSWCVWQSYKLQHWKTLWHCNISQ